MNKQSCKLKLFHQNVVQLLKLKLYQNNKKFWLRTLDKIAQNPNEGMLVYLKCKVSKERLLWTTGIYRQSNKH